MKLEVMILGEEGSGKTLYLAGLHRAMGSAQMEIPVTLRMNESSRGELGTIYRQAIRPDDPDFPPGTPWGVKEWLFDCVVTGADNREYTPFSVGYADYDGSMIDPGAIAGDGAADPAIRDFLKRQETAHAFLILIDGMKMHRLLKGDERMRFWLDDYLPPVLQVITRRRPVHLVVTKWSILDREGISLDKIREALLTQETLRDFVEFHEARESIIRLIPVDIFGPFAQLDDQERMVKVPQARVAPVNVRVPFAALLPDIIQNMIAETTLIVKPDAGDSTSYRKRARTQVGEQLLKLLRQNPSILFKQAEDPLVSFVTGLLRHTTAPAPVKERRIQTARSAIQRTLLFVQDYMAQLQEQVEKQQQQLRHELNQRQTRIDSERAAVDLAIAGCHARLQQFERQYPASKLRVTEQ